MKKENLEKAKQILMNEIAKMDIEAPDRTELMINIYHFLDEQKYEKNIKILSKKRGKRNV